MGPIKNEVVYYYVLDSFEESRKDVVIAALQHMEDEVSCLTFKPYSKDKKINDNMILHFVSIDFFPDNFVGWSPTVFGTHVVVMANRGHDKDNTHPWLDNHFFFKLVLHEVSHALGMYGHVSKGEDAHATSHLSPVISYSTQKELFKKDVEYLEELVCEKDL